MNNKSSKEKQIVKHFLIKSLYDVIIDEDIKIEDKNLEEILTFIKEKEF